MKGKVHNASQQQDVLFVLMSSLNLKANIMAVINNAILELCFYDKSSFF